MILDTQTKFSDAQALTATAISTNVLDTRNGTKPALADEGIMGHDLWLIVQAVAALTAAGAATVVVTLESSSTADLATTPTVHYTSAAIPVASLVAGFSLARVQLPSGDYQRYVGVRFTVATGPFTGGTISAFLTPDPQRNVIYPSGFTVQ